MPHAFTCRSWLPRTTIQFDAAPLFCPQIIGKFKGADLKGRTYEPLFPYYAHLKEHGAFKVSGKRAQRFRPPVQPAGAGQRH